MKGRKRCGVLAAVLMLLLAAVPKTAYGAGDIQTKDLCSVEFRLENLETEEPVVIHLYRVAEISAYGTYTVTGDGEEADALQTALDNVKSDTSPETWLEIAEFAEKFAGADRENGIFPNTGERDTIGSDGTVTFSELNTGLYLAAAEPAQSAEYRYTFTPYLISLPDNRYYQTDPGDDTWIYHLTGSYAVGLKAAWELRYTDLVIRKTLDSYDRTLGTVSCIFRIEAEKGQAFHYSDVVSLQFDGNGMSRDLSIQEKIPVGADVTVTEVYAGAGYQLQGNSGERKITMTVDGPNEAVFVNEHQEGSLKGGSSVVNHFVNLGAGTGGVVWDNEKLADSTVQNVRGGGSSETESE